MNLKCHLLEVAFPFWKGKYKGILKEGFVLQFFDQDPREIGVEGGMALSPSQFSARPSDKTVYATLTQLVMHVTICESGIRTKAWECLVQDRKISPLSLRCYRENIF